LGLLIGGERHGEEDPPQVARSFFLVVIVGGEPPSLLRGHTIQVEPSAFHATLCREELRDVEKIGAGRVLWDVSNENIR